MFGCGLFWRGSGAGNLVLSVVVKGCGTFQRRALTSCLVVVSCLSHMLHNDPCHEVMQPRQPSKEPVPCNLDFHPLPCEQNKPSVVMRTQPWVFWYSHRRQTDTTCQRKLLDLSVGHPGTTGCYSWSGRSMSLLALLSSL